MVMFFNLPEGIHMPVGVAAKEIKITIARAVKEDNGRGWWNGEMARLSECPDFLKRPAKGQFGKIEAVLIELGLEVPLNWQVQHMLVALAVAGARMVNDRTTENLKVDFDSEPPEVTLITDPYFRKRLWNEDLDTGVRFQVKVGEQRFRGDINVSAGYDYSQHDPKHASLVGLPTVGIDLGNGKSVISSPGRLLSDEFMPTNDKSPLFTQLIEEVRKTIQLVKSVRGTA